MSPLYGNSWSATSLRHQFLIFKYLMPILKNNIIVGCYYEPTIRIELISLSTEIVFPLNYVDTRNAMINITLPKTPATHGRRAD